MPGMPARHRGHAGGALKAPGVPSRHRGQAPGPRTEIDSEMRYVSVLTPSRARGGGCCEGLETCIPEAQ